MECETEIIDFYRPKQNINKNLFVSDIVYFGCPCSGEEVVLNQLYTAFSRFGCIYEVQVFPVPMVGGIPDSINKGKTEHHTFNKEVSDCCSLCQNTELSTQKYYAFVKFFSSIVAKRAKQILHLTHFLGKDACKVNFAKRKKALSEESVALHATRCRELANFYLGFNGWSSSLTMLGEGTCEPTMTDKEWSCEVVYQADLDITHTGQVTSGIGVCQETITNTTVQAKMQTKAVCHKRAVDRALQNAFTKLLLVVLKVGETYKVVAEVDTTVVEETHELADPGEADVMITELNNEPADAEGDEQEDQTNLTSMDDLVNVDILKQLEQDT